jgi:hypothetical protein
MQCGSNAVLTGVEIRLNNTTDANSTHIQWIRTRCQDINGVQLLVGGLAPIFGTATFTTLGTLNTANKYYDLSCPTNYVVVGIKGNVGNSGTSPVEQLGATCMRLFGGNMRDPSQNFKDDGVKGATPGTSPVLTSLTCLPVSTMGVEEVSAGLNVGYDFSTNQLVRVQLRCR